ncbi:flagellar protein [Leptospira gomenensis]|uniref:Flagellar protein n=1 Tax=Leptospira gomenensis TaxID=2484974 RepID=A0A5F1YE84_9LEPT|nr:flagellar FlbD family protein [Leptospira gomenensis]TGK34360.1 flagellar protein [Leptospira gomenensis]TGK37279.1 flagellar protein [Leptospira gomenensis]TGK50966.1 flagellar protein [Leptospira gomenensis]TGK56588.1 flagellar protein [Leptospira gomenensis]
MILLHRLKGDEFVLNASHIESLEANPDTTITLSNDRKYVVKESVPEVIDKILEYKKRILVFPLGSSPDQFKRME